MNISSDEIRERNNVRIFGNGQRVMLFAHGFGCDQTMWKRIVPHFENDYRIVLFDYVGCGGASLAAYSMQRYATLTGYTQDVLDICSALQLRDAIFIGHSVSATIGALASIQNPDAFGNLVMVCPSPRYIDAHPDYVGGFAKSDIDNLIDLMVQNHLGWANYLAPIVMKNADDPSLTEELQASFCATDPLTARAFACATFYADNRDDMAKLMVPSLIMQCMDDSIAPPSVGEFLARTIPHNVFKQLRATGHCPHISHPLETSSVIKAYLAEQRVTQS